MPICHICGNRNNAMKCVCENCSKPDLKGTNFDFLAGNLEEMAFMLMCPYDHLEKSERNCVAGCFMCCLNWLRQKRRTTL